MEKACFYIILRLKFDKLMKKEIILCIINNYCKILFSVFDISISIKIMIIHIYNQVKFIKIE